MKLAVCAILLLAAGSATGETRDFYTCKSDLKCIVDACGLITGFQEPHGGTAWTTGCSFNTTPQQIVDPDHDYRCAMAVVKACAPD